MTNQKIAELIDQLAKSLGVAADHVWQVLVYQQYIDGIKQMIIYGVIFCVALVGFLKCLRLVREEEEFWIIGCVLFGLAVVMTFCEFVSSIGLLINPEYYAIQEILDALK